MHKAFHLTPIRKDNSCFFCSILQTLQTLRQVLAQSALSAYEAQDFEDLHDIFKTTFQRAVESPAIQDWNSSKKAYKEMEEKEEKRREEDKKGNFDSPHLIEAAEPRTKGKGKRARDGDGSPERAVTELTSSASRQVKRQKSDIESENSPSSRAARTGAATRKEASSATREHGTRSKKPTASSFQQPVAGPSQGRRAR
ncbi:hypothetical protein OF83DRAFT_1168597 [Amylostereum chailletii]|nr:hypothetical protein OF83DRAFT_1168597 [Amylostereum chailletii]